MSKKQKLKPPTAIIGKSIFDSNRQTLVNPVNCVGVMGAGLAKEFKARFPLMFDEYARLCLLKHLKVGRPMVYTDSTPWVLNFPTKQHYGHDSKMEHLTAGMNYLFEHYQEMGITSLAVPMLGCGFGKLDPKTVLPYLRKAFGLFSIPVDLYVDRAVVDCQPLFSYTYQV